MAQYAELWLRDGGDHRDDPAAYAARYDAWLDDFERAKVSGVGFGWISLRKSGSDTPVHHRGGVAAPGGAAARLCTLLAWFARQDFLRPP